VRSTLRRAAAAVALTLATLGAALAAPRPLGAQEARPTAGILPAAPVSASTVEAQLAAIPDAAARASIGALISEATRRGLPAEPLVTKALEGVEKGAPPARIESAVRAMTGRLATASQALAPVLTLTDLRAGADALGAGVTAEVLRHVREVSANRSVAVPVGVVAQLTARGVPAAKAGAAVAVLLRRGAGNAQLLALQQLVQEDVGAGLPPSTALDIRTRNLTSVLPPPAAAPAATADALEQFNATPTPRSGPPATPQTPRKKP
jgi:hypothetical protein